MSLHGDVDDAKPTDSTFSASVSLCCKIFLAIYIFFKVLYNVVLTFTALSTLFAVWMHASLRSVDKVEEIRFWSRNRSGTLMKQVDEMLQGHLENDSDLRSKMRDQCDKYMDSLIQTIQAGVGVANDDGYNFRSTNMHLRTKVLQDQWRNIDERIQKDTNERVTTTVGNILSEMDRFSDSGREIFSNRWWTFPKRLFHKNRSWITSNGTAVSSESGYKVETVDFSTFLGISTFESMLLLRVTAQISEFKQT